MTRRDKTARSSWRGNNDVNWL